MITLMTNKFTDGIVSRYHGAKYYDREDVYFILQYLQKTNLIDIINEEKLSNQLDDKLNEWEELDECRL